MIEKDIVVIHDLIDRYITNHQNNFAGKLKFPRLSYLQKSLLKWIERQDKCGLDELAAAFNKTTTENINKTLQSLKKKGLITYQPITNDDKVNSLIQITQEGKKFIRVEEEAIMEFASQVRSVLDEKEVQEMDFLMSKVITWIS